MLQSQQRPGIQEAEVGKIVRDVFGPDVHRRKTKHKGESVYKYFGLKRKLKDNSHHDEDVVKQVCQLDPTSQTIETLLERVHILENQLADKNHTQANLEYQLQEVTEKNQLLHQSVMQHEQDKLALKDKVQLSSQRASSLENELQQATLAIGVKQ